MMRLHISTASSMLCVTIKIDLIGMPPFDPEVEKIGAQGFGGQHVERRKWFIHQENVGMHDERAGEADALAHAAGQLLRKGGFEPIEADEVDRLQGAHCALLPRHFAGAQAELDIGLHRVSQGNSAKLWNTMATPSTGPSTGLPQIADVAGGRLHEAGDDAKQG